MDLYGINDYRNFLSHHGVVGMHWGIRRYQPYGIGGYNRVGGKTGKMIGEARKTGKVDKETKARQKDFARQVRSSTILRRQKFGRGLVPLPINRQTYLLEHPTIKKSFDLLKKERAEVLKASKPISDFNALSKEKKLELAEKAAKKKYAEEWEKLRPRTRKGIINEFYDKRPDDVFYQWVEEESLGSRGKFNGKDMSYGAMTKRKAQAAFKYDAAREKIVNDLLGKYGKTTVAKYRIYEYDHTERVRVKSLVDGALTELLAQEQEANNAYLGRRYR